MQRTLAIPAMFITSFLTFAEHPALPIVAWDISKTEKVYLAMKKTNLKIIEGSGKCNVSLVENGIDVASADGPLTDCQEFAKEIIRLKGHGHTKDYILQFCPVAYFEIPVGDRRSFFCIRGERADEDQVFRFESYLSVFVSQFLKRDF